MPDATWKVPVDTPEFDHGEMEEKPTALPKATSASVNAAAAKPPATMARQEMACGSGSASRAAALSVRWMSVTDRPLIGLSWLTIRPRLQGSCVTARP